MTETQSPATDECYRCGYDLRGVANDAACPECGLLAERSRHVSDDLHDTRPPWLASIARGVWLILLAIILSVALPFILKLLEREVDAVLIYFNRMLRLNSPVHVFLLGFDLAAVILVVGVLLLTRRERYEPADRADRRRRFWLRIAATAPIIGLLVAHLFNELWARYRRSGTPFDGVFLEHAQFFWPIIVTLACAPLPLLLFLQLRNLAKRARSAHLAEHCLIVGVGASLAILYVAVLIIVFDTVEQLELGTDWAEHSQVSLYMILIMSVSAFLFVLWAIYLLVRFAIAFRRAARQLRHKWTRDDRAVAPASA